jgi:hypothetical protein
MKALGVGLRLDLHRMLFDARCAEVVALAAHRDDQRVVAERALQSHFAALFVERRGDVHLAARAVESDHLADAITKPVPVRLRQVVDLVRGEVHAARGDLVQLRLPHVRAVAVDQRDVDDALHAVAEPRRELQTTGTAADDDDAVPVCRNMRASDRDAARSDRAAGRRRRSAFQSRCHSLPRRENR